MTKNLQIAAGIATMEKQHLEKNFKLRFGEILFVLFFVASYDARYAVKWMALLKFHALLCISWLLIYQLYYAFVYLLAAKKKLPDMH